jgi:WD40 repeat protein
MNHFLKILILIGMLLSSMMFSQAQGATPQYIVDAARHTAEADLPDLGGAIGWSHIILNNITDTSLGCVLVTGVALPSPIDVYRLELTYGGSDYSVHVSSDATMVQLCDERFPGMTAGVVGANDTSPTGDTDGDGVINSDDQCPTVAGVITAEQSGCPAVTEGDRDGDSVLDSIDFCPEQAGSAESDGCPLLTDTDGDGAPNVDDICPGDAGVIRADFAQGCPVDGSGISPFTRSAGDICQIIGDGVSLFDNAANNATIIGTYSNSQAESGAGNVIGRTAETGWYQISGGWVTATAVALTGSCYNIPVANATVGSATGCFLRSSGTFANVRNGPNTNSTQVTQIFPNQSYAVLGVDASTNWLFFNQGWANRSVLELSGDCSNLLTLDPQFVGSGSVFFCQPEYNGYLPPRITLGTANARITAGNIPNRLRAEPTISATQIGEIQPSRTLDAIIDGPACNEGYVWWQVNIDNTIGWTVESDINANAYYIEPIDGAGNPLDQAPQPTPVSQSPPPSDTVNPSTFQTITSANSTNVDTLTTLQTQSPYIVAWSPIQSVLATISITDEIDFYSYPTFDNVDALYNLPDSLQPSAVAFSADDRFLAIGNKDGQVYVVELEDGGFIGGSYLPQSHTSPVRALSWSHDGYKLASVSGFSEVPIAGAEWTLKVWDISAGIQSPPNMFINYAFPYPLSDVAFSSDGTWIAVTGESPADQQAAIWIYNTGDMQLYFSKGLVYMQGFSFVTETPDPALGDFVYNNGDTAYRITVSSEDDAPIYSESGMLINEIEFRSQVITGAEVLFAVTNATPGAFSGEETLTFVNALHSASPTASLTVSTTDIAFSPDGRVLAVADVNNGRLLILGIVDR